MTQAPLASFTLDPTLVSGGVESTGALWLVGAAPGGIVVNLASNNAAVTVPASVTVAAGDSSASFTVATSTVTSIQTASISASYGGVTQQATLTVSPTAVASVSLSPASVTAGNPSTGTVALTAPAPSGGVVVDLGGQGNPAPGVPASVTVPAGETTATFTVTTSAVASVQSASIAAAYGGTSKYASLTVNPGPSMSLSPQGLNFSPQAVGTSSATQTVTLSNTGTTTLLIAGITASGDFSQTNNCGSSVSANASCTVTITFAPTISWERLGSISISDNSPGSPQTITVGGLGEAFTLAPATGSSLSATVAPGQAATYTISVVGVNETVNFTCTAPNPFAGLYPPAESTCTVSPNSVTLGSSPANIKVTVTTTAPSASTPRFPPLSPTPPLLPAPMNLVMLALLLAVLAWTARGWKKAGGRRHRVALVTIAAGLLLALLMAACGGGGGGGGGGNMTPPNPGTGAGTYTMTVTGTVGSGSTAQSNSVNVTLTVS